MSKNINIYPNDFTFSLQSTGSAPVNTLADAVNSLSIQLRDAAVRLAHTRRISGQNEIFALEQQTKIYFGYMPLYRIGKKSIPVISPITGNAAFLVGGVAVYLTNYVIEFSYSNQVLRELSVRLGAPKKDIGSASNTESGKFVGGETETQDPSQFANPNTYLNCNTIEKLTYAKRTLSVSSLILSDSLAGVTGNMGTSSVGFLAGGRISYGYGSKYLHQYNHNTDAITVQQSYFATNKYSPNNGLSSQTAGYICGGVNNIYGSLTSTSTYAVDEINYATVGLTPSKLFLVSPRLHYYHAAFGNDVAGYLAGGINNDSFAITTIPYTSLTASVLSVQLNQARYGCGGASSNLNGYILGGDTSNGHTSIVSQFNYASQAVSDLSVSLAYPASGQGITSDYLPSF